MERGRVERGMLILTWLCLWAARHEKRREEARYLKEGAEGAQ